MTLHVYLLSLTGGYECSKHTVACSAIFLQAGAYQKTLKLGKNHCRYKKNKHNSWSAHSYAGNEMGGCKKVEMGGVFL